MDWGLTLHAPLPGYQSKSTPGDSAIAFRQPSGAGESAQVVVSEPGDYAIAVWKVGEPDLAMGGSYRLHVYPATPVSVEPVRPSRTGISAIAPNPAWAGVEVSFDLSAAADVSLGVYDLRGARVATLTRGLLPAGHHRSTWSGRDDSGHAAAPGIYFVELRAGTVRQVRMLAIVR